FRTSKIRSFSYFLNFRIVMELIITERKILKYLSREKHRKGITFKKTSTAQPVFVNVIMMLKRLTDTAKFRTAGIII
ncbi:MAG: hypothetical protein K8H86_05305, partial [Ignavibacteriaceae bacterium]|nr:hypothetical protein [Ignavibacteriaceae bacterium]